MLSPPLLHGWIKDPKKIIETLAFRRPNFVWQARCNGRLTGRPPSPLQLLTSGWLVAVPSCQRRLVVPLQQFVSPLSACYGKNVSNKKTDSSLRKRQTMETQTLENISSCSWQCNSFALLCLSILLVAWRLFLFYAIQFSRKSLCYAITNISLSSHNWRHHFTFGIAPKVQSEPKSVKIEKKHFLPNFYIDDECAQIQPARASHLAAWRPLQELCRKTSANWFGGMVVCVY